MKYDIAMKWVKALRSGKYKQTTGTLQDENGHCCLGVLCEIAPKSLVRRNLNGRISDNHLNDQPKVKAWSRIKSQTGSIEGEDLATLNDKGAQEYGPGPFISFTEKFTFHEIADIIQTNWRKL